MLLHWIFVLSGWFNSKENSKSNLKSALKKIGKGQSSSLLLCFRLEWPSSRSRRPALAPPPSPALGRPLCVCSRPSRHRPSSRARRHPLACHWHHGPMCQEHLPPHAEAGSPFQNRRRPYPAPNLDFPCFWAPSGYISRMPSPTTPISSFL
jgi:hypothetical protein